MLQEFATFKGFREEIAVVKKSKFISAGAAVFTEEEAEIFLNERRGAYKGANHHCFAYRIEGLDRFSDDKEPSGTAGAPILSLLKSEGLMNCIIVVSRYFGGTLLGTGGLARTYGHAAKLLISKGAIVRHVICSKISITADYTYSGKLQYILANSDLLVTDAIYADKVKFSFLIKEEDAGRILPELTDCSNGSAVVEVVGRLHHEYPWT
ncbi:MAG: YigZ family protein [Clostridiales bacterium]|jgi:uncharacterized YigZ family protein|nr:YigZ family protein [Clostridiales bacterium]